MSLYLIKSIVGIVFFLAGITAVASMLAVMGKQEKKTPAPKLRKIHRSAGIIFFILMLVNAVLGFRYWAATGDVISTRAVFHAVLALALVILLLVKIFIVRFYKNFLRFAPAMGISIFCLAFLVFSVSGGYYGLRSLLASTSPSDQADTPTAQIKGDIANGIALFQSKCSACHYADREEAKLGPGLANLLKNEKLPASNRSATLENVRTQILRPIRGMPAFPDLADQEMADLLAYLKSL